ncbi:unnamed protein product, partial [Didymodactylos carnosus]
AYLSTMLWQIENVSSAFLFGSIHYSYLKIWPSVSDYTVEVFENSKHVYGEVDYSNSVTYNQFMHCIEQNNISFLTNKFSDKIDDNTFLDKYLILRAKQQNKTTNPLESIETHCQTAKILYGTDYLSENQPESDSNDENNFIYEYNCGKFDYATAMGMWHGFQKVYGTEVWMENYAMDMKRHREMAKRIHQALIENPNDKFFFIMGVLHLIGSDTVISVLENDYYYTINRILTDRKKQKTILNCKEDYGSGISHFDDPDQQAFWIVSFSSKIQDFSKSV